MSRHFGAVLALSDASLQLRRREVHVLAGENGSGKTTLMNVLAGLYQPDAGSIWIDDHDLAFGSARDALQRGIGMVHQHFELVAPFSALENTRFDLGVADDTPHPSPGICLLPTSAIVGSRMLPRNARSRRTCRRRFARTRSTALGSRLLTYAAAQGVISLPQPS
ncbi:MAG: ATP-binding cassette domain-containing protein [Chloroflexi bacterium]|nr:ATP-binding cassette domain-containing protein [Chloroflexota bacterium]